MRRLLYEILHSTRRDPATLPLRTFLRGLSFLYGGVVRLRALFYHLGWLRSETVSCRVVSIGNITAGGTGKTPAAIMIARMLGDAGYRVAVVSRGYARKSAGVRVVSDQEGILLSAAESGDEPHLIASSLPGVPVVVGPKRAEASRLARERFRPDIILLDDAFQHLQFRRDLDIVTLSADQPFGNGFLLPRGLLREPASALDRAGAILVTRIRDNASTADLRRKIDRLHPGIPVFFSRHIPIRLRSLAEKEVFPPDHLEGKAVAALSNIACPESFHRTLESLGVIIAWKHPMPDHHRHTEAEISEISREAPAHGAEALVMTAKDERDLPEECRFGTLPVFILDIEMALVGDKGAFLKLVTG